MTIRVLVVDDSSFMRRRVCEILQEDKGIQVIGVARNGLDAIQKSALLMPDVITMDIEMPVLDGVSAVKHIMREHPTPILMFSAATQAGARATLAALEAGAMDFLPKRLDESDRETAKRLLRNKVRDLGSQAKRRRQPIDSDRSLRNAPQGAVPRGEASAHREAIHRVSLRDIRLLVMAASTGGPVAIQHTLSQLPAHSPFPIILIQHMPENFTASFAERLDQQCQIRVKEAKDGDELEPGLALLAPGGYQLELSGQRMRQRVVIRESLATECYRPSADVTFASIAQNFPGKVLAVIMTGMGADGRLGAEKLKAAGASVWAQSEASCTIYGMPRAVVEAHLADGIYDLDEIAYRFRNL